MIEAMIQPDLPFSHFLITRFNLKSKDTRWNLDRNKNITRGNDWLEHRIQIFKNYCFPSVQHQSNKNFTWLIYLDQNTSEKHLNEIKAILTTFSGNVNLMFSKSYDDFQENHTSDILKLSGKSTNYIITTRLDNDDVVHKNFIDIIQKKFNRQDFIPVNFVKQYMFDPVHKDRLFVDYAYSGHFVSLIEKINSTDIKGCYSRGDRYWNVGNEIVQVLDNVYCLELIHEKNLINDYRGFPIFYKTDLSAFQLPGKVKTHLFKYPSSLKIWKMSWKKLFIFEFLSKLKIK